MLYENKVNQKDCLLDKQEVLEVTLRTTIFVNFLQVV